MLDIYYNFISVLRFKRLHYTLGQMVQKMDTMGAWFPSRPARDGPLNR
jgi:hypothetical protein